MRRDDIYHHPGFSRIFTIFFFQVPIKSLLGHRSQAPPEVRHVSGQHIKEFRDFLAKHSETFVIRGDDDIIYLKKYEGCTSKLGENTANSLSSHELTSSTNNPKLDPQGNIHILCKQNFGHF